MRTLFVALVTGLLMIGLASGAFAMAMENDGAAIQQPNYPTGLADLLNSQSWVYSYWINSIDRYYYAGDAKAFNKFVLGYSKLGNQPKQELLPNGETIAIHQDPPPLRLVLRDGGAKTGGWDVPKDATTPFDWRVEINGWSSSYAPGQNQSSPILELWTGGKVNLAKVNVPLNVEVIAEGTPTPEIKSFITAHEAKRKAVKQ